MTIRERRKDHQTVNRLDTAERMLAAVHQTATKKAEKAAVNGMRERQASIVGIKAGADGALDPRSCRASGGATVRAAGKPVASRRGPASINDNALARSLQLRRHQEVGADFRLNGTTTPVWSYKSAQKL